jgi:hypothetical protein
MLYFSYFVEKTFLLLFPLRRSLRINGPRYAEDPHPLDRGRGHQPGNLTVCEILQYALSEAGYAVDVAATAATAHMHLNTELYGLVIADWLLPDGDGIYLADRGVGLGSKTLIITELDPENETVG